MNYIVIIKATFYCSSLFFQPVTLHHYFNQAKVYFQRSQVWCLKRSMWPYCNHTCSDVISPSLPHLLIHTQFLYYNLNINVYRLKHTCSFMLSADRRVRNYNRGTVTWSISGSHASCQLHPHYKYLYCKVCIIFPFNQVSEVVKAVPLLMKWVGHLKTDMNDSDQIRQSDVIRW